jgi:hypothetical protein
MVLRNGFGADAILIVQHEVAWRNQKLIGINTWLKEYKISAIPIFFFYR